MKPLPDQRMDAVMAKVKLKPKIKVKETKDARLKGRYLVTLTRK